jgi:hypothetical protein
MNKKLQDYARKELKEGLAKLPEANQQIFKRMYSPKNLEKPINDVVDSMLPNQLSWAMEQVDSTIEKNLKLAKNIES